MMVVLFISYKVSYILSDSSGNGNAIFSSSLLSGPFYWRTEYEENIYSIDKYDTNLIYEIK